MKYDSIIRYIRYKVSKDNIDYKDYWHKRYEKGGKSGEGSYGILAEYKADVINAFVEENDIDSTIEFGCGDGNQLNYMNYKKYLGLDVAESSIDLCKYMFGDDPTKSFLLYNPKLFMNKGFINSELVVCLDVLYHIIPEDDFIKTLKDIFSCSSKYVILYTTIIYEPYITNSHIKRRDIFTYLTTFSNFSIETVLENNFKHLTDARFIILKRKI